MGKDVGGAKVFTTGDCFAPAEVLDTQGERNGPSLFGTHGSELVIFFDYLRETSQIRVPGMSLPGNKYMSTLVALAGLGGPDWFDDAGEPAYIKLLTTRHPHVTPELLKAYREALDPDGKKNGLSRPDILTLGGMSLLGPNRNEYYEIKPDSPDGIDDCETKLKKIERMYRKPQFRLPYRAGVYYPLRSPKDIELPGNGMYRYLLNCFKSNYKIKDVRLYLRLRRGQDGGLLYKLCIEIDYEDERKRKALAKAAAKHLYAAYLACQAPQYFVEIKQELGDYSFEGDEFPRIRCQWDVIDGVRRLLPRIEESMFMRGLALPGQSFLICCDDPFYQSLVSPTNLNTVRDVWQYLLGQARFYVEYLGGETAWVQAQPLIYRAEEFAKAFNQAFPHAAIGLEVVLNWIKRHPYETVALLVVGFVLTASLAAWVDGALIVGALAEAEAGAGGASALGRMAMIRPVASAVSRGAPTQVSPQITLRQILGRAAQAPKPIAPTPPPAPPAPPRLAPDLLQRIIRESGKAANDILRQEKAASFLLPADAMTRLTGAKKDQVEQALAPDLLLQAAKQVSAMGEAFLLAMSTYSIYSAPPPSAAPQGSPVSQGIASMFMIKPTARPRLSRPPKYESPEKGNFINLRTEADLPYSPDDINPHRPPVLTRYLGKVTVLQAP